MRVGFIGLGAMGTPMAVNVQQAGYELTIHDVRREQGRNLEEAGAVWAASPAETAERSDVVLLSLPGPVQVESVVLGENGVFADLAAGGACIDTSTNSPALMRRIAEEGASRGIQVLDAPISGGIWGARDASLTVFAGGEEATFKKYRPLLQCLGKTVVHMGPLGSGHVAKLVNNLMMYINFIGACEGMALGVKAGLDPQVLLDVIKPSMGHSTFLERSMKLSLDGKPLHFVTDGAVKDLRLCVELGGELGVPLEVGPLVETLVTRYRDAGHGQKDTLEYIRDYLQRSGADLADWGSGDFQPPIVGAVSNRRIREQLPGKK